MNIYKKLQNEKKYAIHKIIIPLIIMAGVGYLLYGLVYGGFFIGWEVYFALTCYGLILVMLLILDMNILTRIYYNIYIEDNKLRIRDGFFSRIITIPLERLYYVSSVRIGDNGHYDSIFVTDKKINHSKIKLLSPDQLTNEHLRVFEELKSRYPEKAFYYYRVKHQEYKFLYYFYMLYKSCDRCKFSDTSMELVKRYDHGK